MSFWITFKTARRKPEASPHSRGPDNWIRESHRALVDAVPRQDDRVFLGNTLYYVGKPPVFYLKEAVGSGPADCNYYPPANDGAAIEVYLLPVDSFPFKTDGP